MSGQGLKLGDLKEGEPGETNPPFCAEAARFGCVESRSTPFRLQFQSRTSSREGEAGPLPDRHRNPAPDATIDRVAEAGRRRRATTETVGVDWPRLGSLRERRPLGTGTKRRGRNPNSTPPSKASIQARPAPFPRSAARPTDHDDPCRSRLTTVMVHESFGRRLPRKLDRSTGTHRQRRKKPSPPSALLSTTPPTLLSARQARLALVATGSPGVGHSDSGQGLLEAVREGGSNASPRMTVGFKKSGGGGSTGRRFAFWERRRERSRGPCEAFNLCCPSLAK